MTLSPEEAFLLGGQRQFVGEVIVIEFLEGEKVVELMVEMEDVVVCERRGLP